jgi:putative SOS response-associated peptidase YedK
MLPLYDRMPVILPAAEYDQWLDCQRQDAEPLHAILRPYPGDDLLAYPVSTRVNNPANEALEYLAPWDPQAERGRKAGT